MARSIFSAAVLLVAVAGVTGCTGSARFVQPPDPNTGVGIVSVPQSDWCQWYWKHEGLELIRKNYPNFKDDNIMAAGEVPAGGRITGPQYGPDNRPIVLNKNGDKEYQIEFRVAMPRTVTTVSGAPMPGVSNPPMGGGVMPAGGVQNLSGMPSTTTTYPPTGQPTYSQPNVPPFSPSMPSGVNGGMPGAGYPGNSYGGH